MVNEAFKEPDKKYRLNHFSPTKKRISMGSFMRQNYYKNNSIVELESPLKRQKTEGASDRFVAH